MRGSKTTWRLATLLLALPLCAAAARADVKIKVRQTMGGQASEQTTYIKGKRQRNEMANGLMTTVQQCDLRRGLQINSTTKTYVVMPYDAGADSAGAASSSASARTPPATRRGGLVTTTVATRDTGERKKMFGYTARHLITTMTTKSSPDACAQTESRMEIDGWYIDAEFALDCDASGGYRGYAATQKTGCQDRHEYKQAGTARTGYPVSVKTTMFGADGAETYTMTQEVVEISQATLDLALFDVPAGYREVKDISEMYQAASAMSGARAASDADDADDAHAGSSRPSAPGAAPGSMDGGQPSTTSGVSSEVGAKRPGIIRIGLASVRTGSVGDGMSAPDLAAALGHALAERLRSANVELVRLEAGVPSLVEAEARQKECDFVVYASVSHKKGGGGFGRMLGKVAGGVVAVSEMGATNSGQVNVKSKDELTLEVTLHTPGSDAPVASKQLKAKAKSDGEDIISTLAEQAAQSIIAATATRG